MAKTEKTAEQRLASLKRFLNKEIKLRKGILTDEFLLSNMQGMELGMYAMELEMYEAILERVEK